MALAQMGSSSQDATCFAVAALCVALLSRLHAGLAPRERRVCLVLSALFLVAITAARPPYGALSLFYLYFAYTFRSDRALVRDCCAAFVATWLATILWSLYLALFVTVPFGLEGFDFALELFLAFQQ